MKTKKIVIETSRLIDFVDITGKVEKLIKKEGLEEGHVIVFSPHTTAGIIINHNEEMLLQDFSRVLHEVAPVDREYSHDMFELTEKEESDGRSNGHSHCKRMFIPSSETIPFEKGELLLGGKQSVFLAELDGGRKRDLILQITGK